MEIKNLVGVVVGLVIAILMINIVAIPLIDSVTDFTEDAENTTGMVGTFVKYDGETIDCTLNDGQWSINGTAVPASSNKWFYANSFVMVVRGDNAAVYDFVNEVVITVADHYHIENGVLTYSSYTAKFDTLIYSSLDGSGTYGSINAYQTSVNVDKDAEIMVVYNGSAQPKVCFYGTYDDMKFGFAGVVSGSTLTPNDTITVEDNLKIISTPISGTEKSVVLNTVQYLYDSTNVASTLTFVPYKYQTPADPPIKTMIDLVPLLLVIVMLIGTISYIYVRS